jgi:hypothetical protein
MPAGDRYVLLQRLGRLNDADRGLLANARCLSEGVDIPTLDGVAFIDPRRSEADIVQAVGRAIRKSDAKTVGTIVIPVFIDTSEDPDVALDSSVFKPVWDVIKALRAHDEELGEQLDTMRREMGRKVGRPRLPGKIHVDVPTTVGTDFASAFEARLVDRTTASWQEHFGCLDRFARVNGHCDVPEGYLSADTSLQKWCEFQRTLYRKQVLSDERCSLLDGIPSWSWNLRDTKWEEGFELLLKHVEQEGHPRVSKRTTIERYPLGAWVDDQRVRYLNGILDPQRRDRLTALPGWSWEPTKDRWEIGFQHLLSFMEANGHITMGNKDHETEDGYKLARWVSKQRSNYRNGSLRDDRRRRLNEVPEWTWDVFGEAWEEGFEQLQNFVAQEGHAHVTQSVKFNGFPLGTWVAKQRSDFTKRKLTTSRVERLAELPGWVWDARPTDRWGQAYAHLQKFAQKNSHSLVRADHVIAGVNLGRWVAAQREAYSKGKLAAVRQQQLEALPGWSWNTISDRWEEWYAKLLQYVEEHGDARVQVSYTISGHRLGSWASAQRGNYAKGCLSSERVRRLEALPAWSWNPPQGAAGRRR